eukprot:446151-Pyramimonas_sp.AAC.1
MRRAVARIGGGRRRGQERSGDERRNGARDIGDAGRSLFKPRTQHHRMVGKNMVRLIFVLTKKPPTTKLCSFVTKNKKEFREQMKLLYDLQLEENT